MCALHYQWQGNGIENSHEPKGDANWQVQLQALLIAHAVHHKRSRPREHLHHRNEGKQRT